MRLMDGIDTVEPAKLSIHTRPLRLFRELIASIIARRRSELPSPACGAGTASGAVILKGSFENRVGQDAQAAPPRSLAALIAWMLFVAGGGSRSRVSTA
jgi:hypothetical protein